MVAGRQPLAPRADGVDHTGALVAQHDGHRDSGVRSVGCVQAAVAHTAGHHANPDLAEAGLVEVELHHLLWLARCQQDGGIDLHGDHISSRAETPMTCHRDVVAGVTISSKSPRIADNLSRP